MSSYIYRMIHERCEVTWKIPVSKDNYSEYHAAWISSAEQLRDECYRDGLTLTAQAIQRIIDTSRRLNNV